MYDYHPQHGYRPVLSALPTSLRVDMNKYGTLLGMVDDEVGQGREHHGRGQFRQHVEMLPPGHEQLGLGRARDRQHVEMLPPGEARERHSLSAFSASCPRVIDEQMLRHVTNMTDLYLNGTLRDGPAGILAPSGSRPPTLGASSRCFPDASLAPWGPALSPVTQPADLQVNCTPAVRYTDSWEDQRCGPLAPCG